MIPVGPRNAFVRTLALWLGVVVLAFCGCHRSPRPAFTELTEARQLTAELRVLFSKASDASDRAVLADTDEESTAFAREAGRTTELVERDVAELSPRLRSLEAPEEMRLADEFAKHLADYRALDKTVLELAVENTNLKAQRLSFNPVRQAADAFRDALQSLSPSPREACRVEPLVSKAVIAVREIQVLQAPHIAEADDAAMTRMETEMASRESDAADALGQLADAVDAKAQDPLAAASKAFAQFKDLSRQVVALSRRNTNVRSLSLALRSKPALAAACDASLRALEDALAKDRFNATR